MTIRLPVCFRSMYRRWKTEKGMNVGYQSDDPYVVKLFQEHAKLVSRFIKNGMKEIHTPDKLPELAKMKREN